MPVEVLVTLTMMIETLRHTWKSGAPLLSNRSVLGKIKTLGEECQRLGFTGTADQAERISFRGLLWDEPVLNAEIETLWSIFERELSQRVFFVIDSADGTLLSSHGLQDDTATRFPRATREIAEARKCLALDQPDAAVFHSMRAMEIAILALAAKFPAVNADRKNWHRLLTDIEREIRNITNSPTKPRRWKKDETFYSEAATDFRFTKDAWRNHAMHGNVLYGTDAARNIARHVTTLLDHLATRLRERP